jgi:hypothetical protein
MAHRVGQNNALEGRNYPPTEWNQIDWQKANRVVRSLRFRIFRATKQQDWKKVKSLIKLLLRSYSNLLVSVRHQQMKRVTDHSA